MRISDWSSDVCSSDLRRLLRPAAGDDRPDGRRALPAPRPARRPVARRRHRRAVRLAARLNARAGLEVAGRQASPRTALKIGRASWRERVCQYVLISGVALSLKNTHRRKLTKYK